MPSALYKCLAERLDICTGKKLYEWLLRPGPDCGILPVEACRGSDHTLGIAPGHCPLSSIFHGTTQRTPLDLGGRVVKHRPRFLFLLCLSGSSVFQACPFQDRLAFCAAKARWASARFPGTASRSTAVMAKAFAAWMRPSCPAEEAAASRNSTVWPPISSGAMAM